jgi:hypothetical protein
LSSVLLLSGFNDPSTVGDQTVKKERKGKKRIGYKRKEKEKKKKKEVGCDLKLGVSCCSEGP